MKSSHLLGDGIVLHSGQAVVPFLFKTVPPLCGLVATHSCAGQSWISTCFTDWIVYIHLYLPMNFYLYINKYYNYKYIFIFAAPYIPILVYFLSLYIFYKQNPSICFSLEQQKNLPLRLSEVCNLQLCLGGILNFKGNAQAVACWTDTSGWEKETCNKRISFLITTVAGIRNCHPFLT